MYLKNFFTIVIVAGIYSCHTSSNDKKFTVKAEIAGATNQKVLLEQLYFTQQPPSIVDTALLENGKCELTAIAEEEGMFRIRLQNPDLSYIFINDAKNIFFKTNLKEEGLEGAHFNTKANLVLKNFLLYLQDQSNLAAITKQRIESLKTTKNNDSAVIAEDQKLQQSFANYKNYIVHFIDTVSDPVVAMFALGYTQGTDENKLKPVITKLANRYPNHQGIITLVNEYNKQSTIEKQTEPTTPTIGPAIGSLAPELKMNDTNDKPFSLSSLRGKYVLVDFWASWCGPCRRENPNVVAAYNKYKNKNFTILGVSLDEDKAAWLEAIQKDKLTWQHISDLKYWSSAAVGLYGFDGIPFNVLVDPSGKIIAKELRETDLDKTLNEVLK